MDMFSAWSDPKLYIDKPTITDSSVGGVVWSEVECPVEDNNL
jgi:hypothetical protein